MATKFSSLISFQSCRDLSQNFSQSSKTMIQAIFKKNVFLFLPWTPPQIQKHTYIHTHTYKNKCAHHQTENHTNTTHLNTQRVELAVNNSAMKEHLSVSISSFYWLIGCYLDIVLEHHLFYNDQTNYKPPELKHDQLSWLKWPSLKKVVVLLVF